MPFQYLEQVENVFLIDTNFFGFPRWNAAYLIKGEEKTVLIDTGDANTVDDVRRGLACHGVTVRDIDYIFVTHCEHPDHSGNVGIFAAENPGLTVFINPAGEEYLTHPEIEAAERMRVLPPGMGDRFGTMTPVSPDRLYRLKDGEEIDIGGGDSLTVTFTPGHQPSGMVLHKKKGNLLFLNDLAGVYCSDTGLSLILSPDKSDAYDALRSLEKIKDISYDWAALGHYGFSNNPRRVIQCAMARIEQMLAMAEELEHAGRSDELRAQLMKYIVGPEFEKLRRLREPSFYAYFRDELGPNLCNGFARFYDRAKGRAVI